MPKDAKFGLLAGVMMVLLIAVVYHQKGDSSTGPARTDSRSPAVPAATSPPAVTPAVPVR